MSDVKANCVKHPLFSKIDFNNIKESAKALVTDDNFQMDRNGMGQLLKFFEDCLKISDGLCKCWRTLILIITPIALTPLLTSDATPESKCGYVVILMGIYWATEPIPLPITALLPVVLLPILGLSSTEKACAPYLKGTNMLFLGCLTLALAVEKSNMHQRIALRVLLSIGTQFQWIVLGFMLTTMFLSMWLVSTASVAMMLPIADAILDQLFPEKSKREKYNIPTEDSMSVPMINGNKVTAEIEHPPKEYAYDRDRLSKILYLSIAFSATIGGVTTLTSNGPNMVMKFVLDDMYDGRDPVDYASWFIFATPFSVISTVICWSVYKLLFMRNVSVPKEKRLALKHVIEKKYNKLGRITFHEFAVGCVFIVMILLYIFHDPQFMSGWSKLFLSETNNIRPKSATAAIFAVVLLFIIPSQPKGPFPSPALLDWKTIQTKLAWGVIILRGGGFSMADAVSSSGLSKLIGQHIALLNFLPLSCLIILLCIVATISAEFMRTSATATIILPVSIQLANDLGVNPLLILVPITCSCAYAFVLPVGTTANSMIYDHADIKISDMLIPGIITKIVCMTLMLGNIYVLGFPIFHLSESDPQWIHPEIFNNTFRLNTVNFLDNSTQF